MWFDQRDADSCGDDTDRWQVTRTSLDCADFSPGLFYHVPLLLLLECDLTWMCVCVRDTHREWVCWHKNPPSIWEPGYHFSTLIKRWETLWYDSVVSRKMDEDVLPPVADCGCGCQWKPLKRCGDIVDRRLSETRRDGTLWRWVK